MKRLFRYIGRYRGKVVLYFLTSLLGSVFAVFSFGMIVPVLSILFNEEDKKAPGAAARADLFGQLQTAVNDFIQSGHDKPTALLYLVFVIVGFTLLKNLFLYLSLNILNPIRNGVVRHLREDLFAKTLSLPISFFNEERKGNLLSRMTADVQEVEHSIMNVLEAFVREPLMLIITLTLMLTISVKLTGFLLIFLPLAGVIISVISKRLKTTSTIAQQYTADILAITEESLSGMRIIKAFAAEDHQKQRFAQLNNLLTRTKNRLAAQRDAGSPLSETLGVLVVGVILWYGGRLIFSNDPGALTGPLFITYIALFSQIINPAKNLAAAFSNVQKGNGALMRIEELLNAPNTVQEKPDARPIAGFDHVIELRNVSFAYGERQILKDINLRLEKGKTVALVGASGAGKSTLADLIPRFHDVSSGEVLIDGVNVRDLRLSELRRLIGVVSQDPILFNDSLRNNIALGNDEATDEQIEAAARLANAHTFVAAKPEGYQTMAGDRGARLSGGERQRITIARALLKNPPILILDEATSSLDTESERLVQDAINGLMQDRTCLVIAHRLSTVRHADEIVVLQAGEIKERGTHDALMAHGQLYRRLIEMQEVR